LYSPDFSDLSQLETLELTGTQLVTFPKLPSSIRHLNMSNMYNLAFFSQESLENLADANLVHLESFACDQTQGFRPDNLRKLLEPSRESGGLQSLSISGTGLVIQELRALLYGEFFANISDLSMADLMVRDDFIDDLIREIPKLERLDISKTYVTGVALKALATRPQGPVKWLDIRHCLYVPIDAVWFSQSMGVSLKYGINGVGGKRRDWMLKRGGDHE
jgi:F-box/TPR repeat protein Pof3